MVTFWSLPTALVLALNVADVAAAGTKTEPGTFSAVLVSVSVTLAPLTGAALLRVKVQRLEAFGPSVVGVQESEDTRTEVVRAIVAVTDLPL
jgi:hypothetical protein